MNTDTKKTLKELMEKVKNYNEEDDGEGFLDLALAEEAHLKSLFLDFGEKIINKFDFHQTLIAIHAIDDKEVFANITEENLKDSAIDLLNSTYKKVIRQMHKCPYLSSWTENSLLYCGLECSIRILNKNIHPSLKSPISISLAFKPIFEEEPF